MKATGEFVLQIEDDDLEDYKPSGLEIGTDLVNQTLVYLLHSYKWKFYT